MPGVFCPIASWLLGNTASPLSSAPVTPRRRSATATSSRSTAITGSSGFLGRGKRSRIRVGRPARIIPGRTGRRKRTMETSNLYKNGVSSPSETLRQILAGDQVPQLIDVDAKLGLAGFLMDGPESTA